MGYRVGISSVFEGSLNSRGKEMLKGWTMNLGEMRQQ